MARQVVDVNEVITVEEVWFWRDRFRAWLSRDHISPADRVGFLELWLRWERLVVRLDPEGRQRA